MEHGGHGGWNTGGTEGAEGVMNLLVDGWPFWLTVDIRSEEVRRSRRVLPKLRLELG